MTFHWNHLTKGLSKALARSAGLRITFAQEDLSARYGEPPTDGMVEELWPTLRDRWLEMRPASRNRVVNELREAGLGDASIKGKSKAGQMEYLRSCGPSDRLKAIVLAAFLEEGSQYMMMPSVMVEELPVRSGDTIEDELTRLAGLLSSRSDGPDSYQLDELLAGLAAERARLGRRKFAVVLHQNVFDYDGQTDYVFLLDSFDDESDAIASVESNALNLKAIQTAQPDSTGDQWELESVDDMPYLPKPANKGPLRVLHDRAYKLRGGPYDTKYNSFRAIGPFDDFVVCDQLFEFINAKFEIWSYFTEVGQAVRAGTPRPAPE